MLPVVVSKGLCHAAPLLSFRFINTLLCVQERMKRAVAALGEEDVQDLIEKQGHVEVTCAFCNDTYQFSKDQIDALSVAKSEEP